MIDLIPFVAGLPSDAARAVRLRKLVEEWVNTQKAENKAKPGHTADWSCVTPEKVSQNKT
jgi:hypothetical protein